MFNYIIEVPQYNVASYLQFQINESIQYELFEKVDSDYDIKKEWEQTKSLILDLAKKGLINVVVGAKDITSGAITSGAGMVNTGVNAVRNKPTDKGLKLVKNGANDIIKGSEKTIKGSIYITSDVFKLLLKLSKCLIATMKYLAKKMSSQEVKNTIINIIRSFREQLSKVISYGRKLSMRSVIIILLGVGMTAGVVYEISNTNSIYNEYKELVAQKKDTAELAKCGIVNNQAVGVDISYCQDYMSDKDWQMLEDNCQFVIIRCGAGFNGPKQDKEYITHYKNAKAHNLKVGIYYFFTDHRDPQAQFNMLRQTMDAVGGKDSLDIKPIIDLEDQSLVNKDVQQYQKNVREFIDLYVQTYKEPPIIYCGAKHISDHGLDFLMTEYHCVFWTAHYGKDGKGTIYKEAETINDKKDIFMNTNFSIKDSTVMLQYSETGDQDLTLKRGLDVDVCWDWNAIRNK